jgi:hypothetical protein
MGGDLDNAVRELIDQVKAGGPKQVPGEIKAALELLPEAKKACCMATFNVPRLFGFVLAMSPIPMPPVQIPTQSNIVVAGKCDNGSLSIHIALPKQHLTEIMGMFMMMQQMQPKAAGITSIRHHKHPHRRDDLAKVPQSRLRSRVRDALEAILPNTGEPDEGKARHDDHAGADLQKVRRAKRLQSGEMPQMRSGLRSRLEERRFRRQMPRCRLRTQPD